MVVWLFDYFVILLFLQPWPGHIAGYMPFAVEVDQVPHL